ncbi:chemotaxis protein CheY [Candidatus Gastranaerophilus sp. (ex Termes propinquus)]|nr:chemotaxis protein CheY [Candidatus Gastranaerophilus sp. (ex Termes propinquus)]
MPISVLVIDDSPLVSKMVTKALEGTDYNVVDSALNGQIGLEKYAQLRPDVVTLDVTMPIMDGLETARGLFRADPNVKIILLSAMGDETLLNEAREIGVRHFLTKPFKPDALKAHLADLFG